MRVAISTASAWMSRKRRVSVTSVMLVSIFFTTSVMSGMYSAGALTMSELL